MKKFSKVLAVLALSCVWGTALIATSCSNNSGDNTPAAPGPEGNKLVVWTFTDEITTIIDNYYKPSHPGVEVECTLTPTDQFQNKLDAALAAGTGLPDIIALEDAFVRKYVEKGDGALLDLTGVYNAAKDKLISYPAEVGTSGSKVYAMAWQANPGAYFYRRSLAKKYLGSDDPTTVQKAFANWNTFLATARDLKKASGGKCVILSATDDLYKPFQGARNGPWIQNGKLVVDRAMEDYMGMSKTLKDEGLEGRQSQWSEGWFAGFKGELKDEAGKPVEVFGTFLPTWGLHYVLKPNAGSTAGDWGMIEGPNSYYWNGTWISVYKGTKAPNLAKEFIRYVTTDDAFQKKWAKDKGDVVTNKNVINEIKDTYSELFLNGQNHYAMLASIAQKVKGNTAHAADSSIETYWKEQAASYVNGEKSKEDAIADFKTKVKDNLGFDSN